MCLNFRFLDDYGRMHTHELLREAEQARLADLARADPRRPRPRFGQWVAGVMARLRRGRDAGSGAALPVPSQLSTGGEPCN